MKLKDPYPCAAAKVRLGVNQPWIVPGLMSAYNAVDGVHLRHRATRTLGSHESAFNRFNESALRVPAPAENLFNHLPARG